MNKITAYFSHYIRGRDGNKTLPGIIKRNCKDAIEMANKIRYLFPELEIYVPAEMDEFPDIALKKGHINIDQLLDVDCEIVRRRDILLAYAPDDNYLSSGMRKEIAAAKDECMQVFIFNSLSNFPMDKISYLITRANKEL